MASGHSVKIANLFIGQSIWGLANSQQCLACLKYLGKHQHTQVQRLHQVDRPEGLLPYPDNSVSLKAKMTDRVPGPHPGSDSTHFPTEKGKWVRHPGLQEAWRGGLES